MTLTVVEKLMSNGAVEAKAYYMVQDEDVQVTDDSPSKRSLSSLLASRLSRRSCFSISALMRFCSLASSDWQHCMVMLLKKGPLSYHPPCT